MIILIVCLNCLMFHVSQDLVKFNNFRFLKKIMKSSVKLFYDYNLEILLSVVIDPIKFTKTDFARQSIKRCNWIYSFILSFRKSHWVFKNSLNMFDGNGCFSKVVSNSLNLFSTLKPFFHFVLWPSFVNTINVHL